jgi:hypothetical protein
MRAPFATVKLMPLKRSKSPKDLEREVAVIRDMDQ